MSGMGRTKKTFLRCKFFWQRGKDTVNLSGRFGHQLEGIEVLVADPIEHGLQQTAFVGDHHPVPCLRHANSWHPAYLVGVRVIIIRFVRSFAPLTPTPLCVRYPPKHKCSIPVNHTAPGLRLTCAAFKSRTSSPVSVGESFLARCRTGDLTARSRVACRPSGV